MLGQGNPKNVMIHTDAGNQSLSKNHIQVMEIMKPNDPIV